MTDRVPLQQMLKVVEREIITLKRLAGPRSESPETATGETLVGLKAVAALLNDQITLEQTGIHRAWVVWQMLDPGREPPQCVVGPAMLSVLVRVPINAGGYMREVRYLGQGARPDKGLNIYAWANVPEGAPIVGATVDALS